MNEHEFQTKLAELMGEISTLPHSEREKLEKLTRATDQLRDKFGFGKVQFGGSLRREDP